jgi:hypothetical protein
MTPAELLEAAAELFDRITDWLDDTSFDVTDNLTEFLEGRPVDEFIDTVRFYADTLHRIAQEDRL